MNKFLLYSPDGGEIIDSKKNNLKDIIYSSLFDKKIFEEYWYNGTNTAELIYYNDNEIESQLLISIGDYGIFLHFINEKESKVSLYNDKKLNEIYENLEDLGVSIGLYLPKELAWIAIKEFLETGKATDKIHWIFTYYIDNNYPNAEYI